MAPAKGREEQRERAAAQIGLAKWIFQEYILFCVEVFLIKLLRPTQTHQFYVYHSQLYAIDNNFARPFDYCRCCFLVYYYLCRFCLRNVLRIRKLRRSTSNVYGENGSLHFTFLCSLLPSYQLIANRAVVCVAYRYILSSYCCCCCFSHLASHFRCARAPCCCWHFGLVCVLCLVLLVLLHSTSNWYFSYGGWKALDCFRLGA